MAKEFTPNFNTPEENFSKEEKNKITAGSIAGNLHDEFRNEEGDISWESEQLAKSHGIYLEFNRAKTGSEKEWMYMIRISVPGGGPITPKQWAVIDDVASKYTAGGGNAASIRFTTRQNVQFHWIKKDAVVDLVRSIAESGLLSLNGCGDNTRNIMSCPLDIGSPIFDGNKWAKKAADFFQLPEEPFIKVFEIDPTYLRTDEEDSKKRFKYGPNLLNRKFKIGFSSVHKNEETGEFEYDNCSEMRTNDMGIAPVIKNGKLAGFQVYIGGGQGERNGKPGMATLAKPLAFVKEEQLLDVMDAVVQVHQKWGDRENRHWARIKYVVKAQGIPWFRERVKEVLGYMPEEPIADFDPGARKLHHGWQKQYDGKWAYGQYIENGRIIDTSPNGKLKTMVRELGEKYQSSVMITANQDLLFRDIPEDKKEAFEKDLSSYTGGKTFSTLRLNSGACVGRDTCRLTYTDSEKFEPELLAELEVLGWGEMNESVGITGCERQCFRPATKSICLIGTGLNRYMFKLGGTEDAKNQGKPLYSEDKSLMYLRSVPRESVATVIDNLFKHYNQSKSDGEDFGRFYQRVGEQEIINFLSSNDATKEFMEKPFKVKAFLE